MKSQKKMAVVYKSKYGAAKQYAEWIAMDLAIPIFEISSIKPSQLKEYEMIIYGGGVYAGSIDGINLIAKSDYQQLVLFSVGVESTETIDFSESLAKTFKQAHPFPIKVFHMRGVLDYKKLNLIHRGIIAMVKKVAEKKPAGERTNMDNIVLEAYAKPIDFIAKEAIVPLVEFVRSL